MTTTPPRGIVFDLDDTLYSERRFAVSGFAAVALALQSREGIPSAAAFRVLVQALRSGRRHLALQLACERFGLPDSSVPDLLRVYRTHRPRLRPFRGVAAMLAALRPRWRIGILTNGHPDIQRRKVAALRLEPLVDRVVLAEECGDGAGKPAPAAFAAVLEALEIEAERGVFVGDDPERDVRGAAAVGMRTIRIVRRAGETVGRARVEADACVSDVRQVPAAAEALLERATAHAH